MISLTQIERMIEHGSHPQLIRRILSNGRCTCPAIREHLLGSPSGRDTPIAACGLALQRCCELSYRPTELAEELARRLIAGQMPDGRFGFVDETALAATAIALRGLIDYQEQLKGAGGAPESAGAGENRLDSSIERGLTAIVSMAHAAVLTHDHATGILIAVWQLGHLSAFRERINIEHVLARLRDRHVRDLDARLVDYAYAQAA